MTPAKAVDALLALQETAPNDDALNAPKRRAIRRGEDEGVLTWAVEAPVDELVAGVTARVVGDRPARRQLGLVAADAYRRLLSTSIQTELRLELKERADAEAIEIFGRNLEQLLLAAPAGERTVLGLDPGFRTGVKAAVVSRTGAVLATDTLYLHQEDRFGAQLTRGRDRGGDSLRARRDHGAGVSRGCRPRAGNTRAGTAHPDQRRTADHTASEGVKLVPAATGPVIGDDGLARDYNRVFYQAIQRGSSVPLAHGEALAAVRGRHPAAAWSGLVGLDSIRAAITEEVPTRPEANIEAAELAAAAVRSLEPAHA